MITIPRPGKTKLKIPNERRTGLPDSVDTQCYLCKSTEKCMVCGRCMIRAYCSREHQKEDWQRHKAECAQFQEALQSLTETLDSISPSRLQNTKTQPDKDDDQTEEMANYEMDLFKGIWMKYDPSNSGILEGESVDGFVNEAVQLSVETILNESSLQDIFSREFGESIGLPPPEFFKQQKQQLKDEMKTDIMNQVVEGGSKRKIRWDKCEAFLKNKFFN